jgi:hypothetical protein
MQFDLGGLTIRNSTLPNINTTKKYKMAISIGLFLENS